MSDAWLLGGILLGVVAWASVMTAFIMGVAAWLGPVVAGVVGFFAVWASCVVLVKWTEARR